MDERVALNEALIAPAPRRGAWLRELLGRDWKVGFLFVLPMVLIMAGADLLALRERHHAVDDGVQLQHR